MGNNLGSGNLLQHSQTTNMVSMIMCDDDVGYVRRRVAQLPHYFQYLCEPVGENHSTFTKIFAPIPLPTLFSFTNGVKPIVSSIL